MGLLSLSTCSVLAGMPSLTLTDLAEMRLQVISFFLVVLLGSALAIKGIWNYLRKDFPRLPRLTYGRSLALVGLWSLLFILVLTMISGARELMTPGAWVKSGATYKLKPEERLVLQQARDDRRPRLEALRTALFAYANQHSGQFPPDDQVSEVSSAVWETSDPSRARFEYVGAGKRLGADVAIVHEPAVFEGDRLVLFGDGNIREMTKADLKAALARAGPAGGTAR